MLHRALLTQVLGAILFAAIPILIMVVTFVSEFRKGSLIANFAFPLTTFHVTFDCLCLLYFVKPYRRFIIRAFKGSKLPVRRSTVTAANFYHENTII
uniref:Uncharacterized protein n=1 Tax=Panagrolaimus davidi TaxID=227884 RepID=A0A914PGA5_9BILA